MSPVAAVCPSPPAAPPAPPLPDACSLQPIMNKKHYCINLPEETCADHAKVRVTGMWSACLISGERCSMSDVEVSCAPLPGAPPPPALPASPPIDLPRYNDVGTCGPGHPGLAGNAIGECDTNGGSFCCSPYGYCGNTEAHCKCDDCIDYRPCYGETVCNGDACPTPPFGYSGPCDPGDEPPKASVAVTVDFECGGATAAAIATLTDELEFMVGRSQSLPPPRPKIASVHVLPAEGDAFTQCAVQAAATNATAHNALSPLPFLRCVSAGADCEAIALGEDAIGACDPEAYGIDGDELRRCIREKGGGGGRSLRDDAGVTIRSAADSGRCALSVNTSGVRIVPPSALKELVDNGVDLRYIGSVDVDCCGGGACNVTDWACEAYTHTERLERNCTYSQQVNARCSSHRDCNSEHCASRFCAVPPPVSVSSGRTCRNPDAVPGATNLDGPILRRMVLDTSTGRKARVPCGPRCPEGELCAENEAQVTRCNDGECCTADGYCGGGSSSLEVNTGLFENALGIGRQSSVLAQACYENEGDWRYVECRRLRGRLRRRRRLRSAKILRWEWWYGPGALHSLVPWCCACSCSASPRSGCCCASPRPTTRARGPSSACGSRGAPSRASASVPREGCGGSAVGFGHTCPSFPVCTPPLRRTPCGRESAARPTRSRPRAHPTWSGDRSSSSRCWSRSCGGRPRARPRSFGSGFRRRGAPRPSSRRSSLPAARNTTAFALTSARTAQLTQTPRRV